MSRTFHHGERRIRVRSVRKNNPDPRRIARALIAYARAQAEADAAADATRTARLAAKHNRVLSPSEVEKGDAA
jgi:hypothetical protein